MITNLPAHTPYLEPHGANWAIFAMRFQKVMKATRLWGHLEGTKPKGASKPMASEIDAAEKWEYKDMVAGYMPSLSLPDTTVMCLSKSCTACGQWEAVSKDYQAMSAYAQADLHQSFMEMRCAKGEDVREFLANLCYGREELAAAGVKVTDKEYKRTILCGIPSKLARFASHLLSSALIVYGATSTSTDSLIHLICEEADRLKSRRACGQSGQGGKRGTTTEEVFATTESDGRRRCRGKCRKCGEEGHWARECCTTIPEQIQAPTRVERPSESLRGMNLRHTLGQDSQASAHALGGQMPLGMVHGRPPEPTDLYTRGSILSEQALVDPKALVCTHKA